MPNAEAYTGLPRTHALRAALRHLRDSDHARDLLFLEAWECQPSARPDAALRISQLRRANPALAAAIRAELASDRR